jgi:hypothetical protein
MPRLAFRGIIRCLGGSRRRPADSYPLVGMKFPGAPMRPATPPLNGWNHCYHVPSLGLAPVTFAAVRSTAGGTPFCPRRYIELSSLLAADRGVRASHQGFPLRTTKRIPVKHARSSARGLLPFGLGSVWVFLVALSLNGRREVSAISPSPPGRRNRTSLRRQPP